MKVNFNYFKEKKFTNLLVFLLKIIIKIIFIFLFNKFFRKMQNFEFIENLLNYHLKYKFY